MVSMMLYPCILCVSLLMDPFVLCVAFLTVFVNCLVKQFAICLGVVVILLFNVMAVFSVDVRGSVGYTVYGLPKNVRVVRVVPVIPVCILVFLPYVVCVFVCWKLSPHLRV